MRVSVYGLGYVGTVTAACLSDAGHHVIGVDVNPDKVSAILEGRSPIVEAHVEELIAAGRAAGRIDATTEQEAPARDSDVSIICVGTPSRKGGGADLTHVLDVARAIARGRADSEGYHVTAIRSTVPPGTLARIEAELLNTKEAGTFGTAANPEFLREGSAVDDFRRPPFTVVGANDDLTYEVLEELYGSIEAPFQRTSVGVAELMKYACNSYHAVKVAFANELGTMARLAGVDGQELMRLFCEDTTLNVSSAYLRPGMAYGGSCLPKDVRALAQMLRGHESDTPLVASLEASNAAHLDRVFDLVAEGRPQRVALVGLSFKSGTDDVRESPAVRIAERLIGRGHTLKIYDPNVRYAALVGANKAYLDAELPHITSLLTASLKNALAEAEVVMINQWSDDVAKALTKLAGNPRVVDTVGIPAEHRDGPFQYDGLCW